MQNQVIGACRNLNDVIDSNYKKYVCCILSGSDGENSRCNRPRRWLGQSVMIWFITEPCRTSSQAMMLRSMTWDVRVRNPSSNVCGVWIFDWHFGLVLISLMLEVKVVAESPKSKPQFAILASQPLQSTLKSSCQFGSGARTLIIIYMQICQWIPWKTWLWTKDFEPLSLAHWLRHLDHAISDIESPDTSLDLDHAQEEAMAMEGAWWRVWLGGGARCGVRSGRAFYESSLLWNGSVNDDLISFVQPMQGLGDEIQAFSCMAAGGNDHWVGGATKVPIPLPGRSDESDRISGPGEWANHLSQSRRFDASQRATSPVPWLSWLAVWHGSPWFVLSPKEQHHSGLKTVIQETVCAPVLLGWIQWPCHHTSIESITQELSLPGVLPPRCFPCAGDDAQQPRQVHCNKLQSRVSQNLCVCCAFSMYLACALGCISLPLFMGTFSVWKIQSIHWLTLTSVEDIDIILSKYILTN